MQAWLQAQDSVAPASRIACLILGEDPPAREACATALMQRLPSAIVLPHCTNLEEAIALAGEGECEWLLPIRACDRVSEHAHAVLHAALSGVPSEVIFWDRDRLIGDERVDPLIKPEWDTVLLRSCDLIGGTALIGRAAAQRVPQDGATTPADEQGVMHLLLSMILSPSAPPPRHIPLLLSHHHQRPFIDEGARTALLIRHGIVAHQDMEREWPRVSIIIPTRDQAALLKACVNSLRLDCYPGETELIIIDNDSVEPETARLFAELVRNRGAKIIAFPGVFNFAAMINEAADVAQASHLCLLNNDVEALDGVWLAHLVSEAMAPEAGAIGARLLYPDGTIQHVGIGMGIGGAAGHVQKGVRPENRWLSNWHDASRRISAVTGACMVIERSKFQAVGGMDAQTFAVDFNDVDLCLKLERQGWVNMIVPKATLVHHESKSRGHVRTPFGENRFVQELTSLRARWNTEHVRDPCHSPLFRKESERCLLIF